MLIHTCAKEELIQNEEKHFHFSAYRIFWLVILCCLVVAGINGLKTPRKTPEARDSSPYSGSDGLLTQILAIPEGSRKILTALDATESRGAIVVFWPDYDGNSVISSYMISYLAWPRQIWSVPMDDQRLPKAVGDFQKASFQTAVFYAMRPPAFLPGCKRIGPMFIEPLAAPSK